jgi:hypothetical protein
MSDERDARIKHATRVVEDIVNEGYSPIEMRVGWNVADKSAFLKVTFLQVPDDASLEEFQALAAAYWRSASAERDGAGTAAGDVTAGDGDATAGDGDGGTR